MVDINGEVGQFIRLSALSPLVILPNIVLDELAGSLGYL